MWPARSTRKRERAREPRLVLVLFLIGREIGANFLNQSLSDKTAKPKQMRITFDTQLKTALINGRDFH